MQKCLTNKTKMKSKYISREKYLEKVKPFIDTHLIKVFVGQRRTGKSYLMYQIMDYIIANIKNANIIYINKELSKFDKIETYSDLESYIKTQSKPKVKNFVFIDEIQLVKDFEKAIKSLFAKEEYDIFITGSNSDLLSGELATLLSGRYMEIKVFPLDYKEFLKFHNLKNTRKSLDKYIKYGGMPYLRNLQLTDEIVYDYLQNIYQAILFKDVIARFNVRNVAFLERLVRFLADNIGSMVSARSIANFLKSQNIKIGLTTILDYLEHLKNAFIINKVNRTDLTGKQIFTINEKFYFTDIGIRNAITGFSAFDMAKIIENIVYLSLASRGYKIFVGKLKDKEIDFIAEKNGEKSYYQVTLRIEKEETLKRELGNLLKIKDNFPKFLITLDEYEGRSNEGIIHLPLRKFLSEK